MHMTPTFSFTTVFFSCFLFFFFFSLDTMMRDDYRGISKNLTWWPGTCSILIIFPEQNEDRFCLVAALLLYIFSSLAGQMNFNIQNFPCLLIEIDHSLPMYQSYNIFLGSFFRAYKRCATVQNMFLSWRQSTAFPDCCMLLFLSFGFAFCFELAHSCANVPISSLCFFVDFMLWK